MKTKSARLLSVILAALMIMSVIPVTASAYTKEGNYYYVVNETGATLRSASSSLTGSITIPDTIGGLPVTEIGEYCFSSNKSITSVKIPETVTSIAAYAFSFCEKLTSIKLPANVKTIANNAFQYCKGLSSVELPEGLEEIGKQAFYKCSSLAKINLPSNLKRIGEEALLNSAFYDNKNNWEDGTLYIGKYLIKDSGDGAYAIKEGTTLLAEKAFYNSDRTEVSLPSSIKSISDYAFYYSSIQYIVIPDTVTEIGAYAFSRCTPLDSITLPASLKSIGDYAFRDNAYLTSIIIPASVEYIGQYAFSECDKLEKAIILGKPEAILNGTFNECTALAEVSVPSTVTAIGDKAFYECESLTDVHFGGNESSWNAVETGANNPYLETADIHYGSSLKATSAFVDSAKAKLSGKVIVADIGYSLYSLAGQVTSGTVLKDKDGKILAPGATLTTGVKVVLADKTEYVLSLDGDVDGDGTLSAADARIALRAAVSLETLTAAQKQAADKEEDGTISAADARILLRVSVGLPEKEPEKPVEPPKPALTISAEQYKYLAGNDFRRVRRNYSAATALGAYVVAFVNEDGDQCILTYVKYKIIDNYSETTLHNITKGKTIVDPENYYDKLASSAWGANRIHYMDLKSEVMKKELICLREYAEILKSGTHSGAGVYVNAATLNL